VKVVIYGDREDKRTEIKELSEAEELTGNLSREKEEDRMMHSVLENDKETIDDGKTIKEALNQGMGCFTPDLMFEQLVKSFSIAKQIYGPSLIRQLTDYNEDYIDRNIRIPEFQKELKKRIDENIQRLRDGKLIEKDGAISDKGVLLASLI